MLSGPPSTAAPEDVGLWARPGSGMVWGGVWLVLLVPAFVEAVDRDHGTLARIVGVGALTAFAFTYLAAMFAAWDRDDEAGGIPKNLWSTGMASASKVRFGVALVVLSVISVAVVGEEGVATTVFLAPTAASILPGRFAAPGIGAATVLVVIGEFVARRTPDNPLHAGGVLSVVFAAVMAGFITLGIRRMRVVMWELQLARQGAEKLATAEERVRIARDLHDVLGHSLTVISMRSQLAARLVDRGETDRAGEEIKAVEELSRSAMAEVREAVAGYRTRPFAAELAAAEATLEGTGLTVEVQRPGAGISAGGEEVLGFVVREGVTNVLRHSRAQRCEITVRHTPAAVVLEIGDDGRGVGRPLGPVVPGNGATGEGNGLLGLAERLGEAGGRLEAGDRPGGGHVLRAEVPR